MQYEAAYASPTPGAKRRLLLVVVATIAFLGILRFGFAWTCASAPEHCDSAFVVSMSLLALWVLTLAVAQIRHGLLVWRQERSPYQGESILFAARIKEGWRARLDAAGNFLVSLAFFGLAGWLVWAIAGVLGG